MKKSALFLALAVVIAVVVGIAYTNKGYDKGDGIVVRALSINDVQSDPLSFTGEIKINGIAATFSEQDKTFFTIRDTAELMTCRDLYCGAYELPAKYTGGKPLPVLADVIDATGSFVKTDTGFHFAVTDFEVRRNIMKLLTKK